MVLRLLQQHQEALLLLLRGKLPRKLQQVLAHVLAFLHLQHQWTACVFSARPRKPPCVVSFTQSC